MTRDIKYYQNRIVLMEGRAGRDNSNIIKKCKRRIKNLQKQEQQISK